MTKKTPSIQEMLENISKKLKYFESDDFSLEEGIDIYKNVKKDLITVLSKVQKITKDIEEENQGLDAILIGDAE